VPCLHLLQRIARLLRDDDGNRSLAGPCALLAEGFGSLLLCRAELYRKLLAAQ